MNIYAYNFSLEYLSFIANEPDSMFFCVLWILYFRGDISVSFLKKSKCSLKYSFYDASFEF